MQWILRLRVCIIICLAVLLISVAVIFSVLRAVLPHATGYKNEIQLEISQQIGLPVEIESIDAAINWFSPRLKLIGVSVFDGKSKVPLFTFSEAFVELDVIASIMFREFIVADVGLIGADISIEKWAENEWSVQGIKFSSEGTNELPKPFLHMLQHADFLLHDSNIYYQDHTGDKLTFSLLNINMDVKNNYNNHKIKFSMNLHEDYGKSLAVVANLYGGLDALAGEVYIEAQQLKLKQWNQKFKLLQQYKIDAVLDADLWITLGQNEMGQNEISSLIAQLTATDISIADVKTNKRWQTEHLNTHFRYIQNNNNWHLNVADLYFGEKEETVWGRPVSVIASSDEDYYHLSADFLRLTDLQEIADVLLSAELSPTFSDISNQIKSYQLQADFFNLSVQLPKEMEQQVLLDKLVVETSVNNFSMTDRNNGLRLAGIDAMIQYSNKQAIVDLQTKDAELDLKELLRQPISAEILQGKIVLDYSAGGWLLNSDQIQLKNSQINLFSRLNLQISAEQEIFVDFQTDFYDMHGKYVRHYLPVGIMHSSLVEWFDMAIVDGHVAHGSFVLHGDLADFPYDNNNGVMQAQFAVQGASIKFMEEWPVITDVSANIKIHNKSLFVSQAKGKTLGVDLFNGNAEFLDLSMPHLTVKIDGRGNNEMLQSYIWQSPLNELLGEGMALFQLKGRNNLQLTLDIPLDKDEVDVMVDGQLTFIDGTIYYPDMGYQISRVNGVIDFTQDSIFADSISAVMNNNPVNINAYTNSGDVGQQAVFRLDGVIDIDYLLQQYDWLPEPWLAGESSWSLNIEIPYEAEDYVIQIKANTTLQGVAVQLSDKIFKPSDVSLDFAANIKVLDDGDLQVTAKLGEISALKSVLADNVLDEKTVTKEKDSAGENNSIVDFFAVRHRENIWSFDVTSKYLSGKGELTEGLSKDTHILLSLDEIDVHALFVSTDTNSNANSNNNQTEPLKPYDFPALRWHAKKVIWDLWTFNDVKLETSWHKHGMLISDFSLQGPAMSLDARGTWLTARDGSHETVVQGNINSTNCGDTLVGLGYQRSLDRCTYRAEFSAKWPAEPYALSWANMKGKTSFSMSDGEILEVDPGAGGRLLGLLNIFRLANRLALDFDDVTRDGFSFDTITGDFEFVNGAGSLKNFDIKASAADINMFGSIGLLNQDYGLLMRVKPHTDTLTFAGAALLGGVAVGAGLALIQKVFDLGFIGHNVYSITGTWDQPIIENIAERNQDIEDEDDF